MTHKYITLKVIPEHLGGKKGPLTEVGELDAQKGADILQLRQVTPVVAPVLLSFNQCKGLHFNVEQPLSTVDITVSTTHTAAVETLNIMADNLSAPKTFENISWLNTFETEALQSFLTDHHSAQHLLIIASRKALQPILSLLNIQNALWRSRAGETVTVSIPSWDDLSHPKPQTVIVDSSYVPDLVPFEQAPTA